MDSIKLELLKKFKQLISDSKILTDAGLEQLILLYKNASSVEQEKIRSGIDGIVAGRLIAFSFHMAVQSVREKSSEKLFNGLIAQSIENARNDFRDNLGALFLLYNSAKLLRIDIKILIKNTQDMASKEFYDFLNNFINRKDLDDDITKLSGYKVIEKPQFDYVWKDTVKLKWEQ